MIVELDEYDEEENDEKPDCTEEDREFAQRVLFDDEPLLMEDCCGEEDFHRKQEEEDEMFFFKTSKVNDLEFGLNTARMSTAPQLNVKPASTKGDITKIPTNIVKETEGKAKGPSQSEMDEVHDIEDTVKYIPYHVLAERYKYLLEDDDED